MNRWAKVGDLLTLRLLTLFQGTDSNNQTQDGAAWQGQGQNMGQQFPGQNFGQQYPGQPFPGQNFGQQFPGQGFPFQGAPNFPGQVFPNPNFPGQFPGQSFNGQGFQGQGYNGLHCQPVKVKASSAIVIVDQRCNSSPKSRSPVI